ncbi:uncharacterized protein LOC579853 isoform X8 [Strongylocentrotus purpuratus]|uniref:Uncharacterized protein n=1 Tax=Strongylocentrotus purpuratus TaxID=7668 RepID=A0A7M7P386_STRPU|nr:uncharacterized protein LOC579853 isoform X8 [Strongylocentrotus purpuratus]
MNRAMMEGYTIILSLLLCLSVASVFSNDAILNGPGPLGLESYIIPDSSLTASSEFSADYAAKRGRLNLVREGNLKAPWIARTNDANQWIQVDLLDLYRITSVATQGRQDSSQWVKSYKLACSTDGTTFHTVQDISTNPAYDKIFTGNVDRNTIVTNILPVPQICRYVRLMPVKWFGYISLRMEIYGEGPVIDINDCSPDPCENGGTCSNGVNTFTCACDPGYTGPTCGATISNGPGPLGLESYIIPDSSLTASSEYSADHGVKRGRLNLVRDGNLKGGWIARSRDANQWIQVDLLDLYRITSVATQGRQDYSQWVKSYKLACSTDGKTFHTVQDISTNPAYDKVFTGNVDRNTIVTNTLPVPQICRYVRLMPVKWFDRISLRMEIYGEGPFTDIIDCSHDPCKNGGTCSDGVNTFTCACDPGYTGPTCGTTISNGPGPLGLERYIIPDSSMTASSEYSADHAANRGRLNLARDGNLKGGWSARANDANQWIQVDLADIYRITSVATQGRQESSQWVTSYELACSTDGTTFHTVQDISTNPAYDKVFTGNVDRNTIVTNILPVPQICRYVRLMPVKWFGHISLRMEIYGEGPVIDINDCSPDPCENGGICNDGVNTFTCVCDPGYTGPTCGTAILNGPGPLGLESYIIPDSSMTASSEFSADYGAKRGRLNLVRDGNLKAAWIARTNDANQWIQVDLADIYRITSVATQGRQEASQWVTSYKLACSTDGTTFYTVQGISAYPGAVWIFTGNADRNTIVTNTLPVPQICRYVRLMPVKWFGYISLRMEIYGEGPFRDINDCSPDPCENGGICNDGVNTFTCVCDPGYTGPTCGTAILNGPGPLGLESYIIPDSSMTASSEFSADYGAKRGRLNLVRDGNLKAAWIARTNDANQWIQVDLADIYRITSVATQGRQEASQWVTSYKLACSTDGTTFYTVQGISAYPGAVWIFTGNADRNTIVTNTLPVPQICRYVRLMPVKWFGYISLRMEIYGEGPFRDINACSPDPCENGGICNDGVNTFTCVCDPGYTGPTCGTDINDCSPDPCENGGTCSDGVNTFTCACDPGYTGPTCGATILNGPGPLGLESYIIPDSSLTASSEYSADKGVKRGRLNLVRDGNLKGGWIARTRDANQWIQVDLLDLYRITSVATQGRQDYSEWVKSYKLACSTDGKTFHTVQDISTNPAYDKVFTGNVDRNTILTNILPVPQICRYVRLMPIKWFGRISLRMEIYGEGPFTDIIDCSHDPCKNGGTCSDGVNTFTCACDPGYTGPTCGTTILNGPGPLGLERYIIPDSSLTASSEYNADHGANRGRLNLARDGNLKGSWSARANDANQWIQVDLADIYRITSVATQGRPEASQWVTSYKLACSTDGKTFHTVQDISTNPAYDKVFTGNVDRNTIVTNILPVPQICRYVRLMPVKWFGHISLRMEIYGEGPVIDINDCSPDPCENGGICNDGVYTFTCVCDPGYTGPTCGTAILNGPGPLGLESYIIPDSSLTASSEYSADKGVKRGRLNLVRDGNLKGGWIARTRDANQWIQVDLLDLYRITSVATQGRQDYSEWVKSYKLACSTDGKTFHTVQDISTNPAYDKVFTGNVDRNTIKTNILPVPQICRYVRLMPIKWFGRISLRMEIYGEGPFTDIIDCSHDPCKNGGTCSDGVNTFTCACDPGYTGPTCGTTILNGPGPLGLERYIIPDSSLTASSEYNADHGANRGRLNLARDGNLKGSWSARANDANQWIQVDLADIYRITSVATQGRPEASQWVTSYKLACSTDGKTFHTVQDISTNPAYDKVFTGNVDRNTIVTNILPVPQICRYVRLMPVKWFGHISLRMEIYGEGPVIDINDCSPDPCENGGICNDGVYTFTCVCDPGYTGPTCGTAILNGPGPLGLESYIIPDSSLTASSEYSADHGVKRGRLNLVRDGNLKGGWIARTRDANQWIQVDLLDLYRITSVATQGRQDYSQWVKSYKLACSTDGTTFHTVQDISTNPAYDKVFTGNVDRNTMKTNILPVPQICRYVRLMPVKWFDRISLRMEIYGEGPFTDIIDCSHDPCKNGGTCSDGVNTFTCACDPGYTGPTCGTTILNGPGPLGLERYIIPDSSLTASSEYNADHGANRGRLNLARDGNLKGSWSARANDANQWIQVDLADIYRITSVATQGRPEASQWVTSYKLACSTDGTTFHTVQDISTNPAYDKVFTGNVDRNTIVTNILPVPQICRYVRLMPVKWFRHISLRMEIYGEGPVIDINDCSPDPCKNGGTCNDGVYTFTCVCDPGYTGPTCGTAILNGPGPLGLESYIIPDSSLTASSEYSADHSVKRVRLNLVRDGNLKGGWIARTRDANQWIQVDLLDLYRITSVATQGRQDYSQWVKSYKLACSTDGTTFHTVQDISTNPAYDKVFTGNVDRNTIKTNILPVPQICRYVRLMPVKWFDRISLRMEIYGEGPFTDIIDCSHDPCKNGGTCSDGVNTFTCACDPGYTGPTCGTTILNGPGPLGLERYIIPDSSLTASSEYNADHGANRGRLNLARDGNLKGGWSARANDANQWIQVDLLDIYRITSVATQGRQESSQWVTSYKLACSTDGTTFYTVQGISSHPRAVTIFTGNADRNTIVTNTLPVPQICLYVRLMPVTWFVHISLRMEIYGEGPFRDINDCSPDPCENGGTCSGGDNIFTCACDPGYTGPTCGTAILNGPGPLGLESYFIPDSSLTASSEYGADNGAKRGRLNLARDGNLNGGWSAGANNANQWIQVDLLDLYRITSVATQGRQESSQWVTSYKLACSTDGMTFHTVQNIATNPAYDEVFIGNVDRNTIVTNTLPVPQICRYVRLMPVGWFNFISLRMEIYGEGPITDCSPDPCENGGICSDGVNTFTCACDPGYTGPTCRTDINDCSPDPCENGGICSDGVNTFTCACYPGYTGPTCGTAILNKPGLGLESYVIPDSSLTASSAYTAEEEGFGTFSANKGRLNLAETAWGAETADTEQWIQVDLLEPYRIIAVATQGNGKTSDPESFGYPGFYEWVKSYKLACRTDDTPFHTVLDINGDDSIFTGNFDKNTIVTNTLSVPQVCRYVRLMPVTWHRYIALRMEIYGEDINDCSPDPCENGGLCSDGVNTVTCACLPGYTGPTCGTDINDCSPDPCENGGICSDGVNTFTCACYPGYTGPTCGTAILNKPGLGLESYVIPDSSLTASSAYTAEEEGFGTFSANKGRLNLAETAWGAETADTEQWIQVDLLEPYRIIAVATQGNGKTSDPESFGYPGFYEWVKSYKLACRTDDTPFHTVLDINGDDSIFTGNFDKNTIVTNTLSVPQVCRYVRLMPVTWHRYIALRMEIYGEDINDCSPDPCENGGICSDGVNTFTCTCDPGYTGATCGTDINDCSPDPCENGGICSDGVNTFTCACNPGYTGPRCGTDIDDCSLDPCENGGICSDGVNTFTCTCDPGYTGLSCVTDIDDCSLDPCENGGICSDGVNTFTCTCDPGYTGPTCGTDIDDCSLDPCENGGICSDGVNTFTCACNPGHTGPTCGTDINDCSPDPCENGSICSDGENTFTCTCDPGYTGPTCGTDINDCSPDPCENGGICSDGVNTFTCTCDPGYTGPTCGTDINDCSLDPCENGGYCTDGVNTFTCACVPGYTGPTCGTDINDCSPDPCENGGICGDGVNTFTCTCDPGYTGPTCGTDINDCSPDPCENGGICSDGVNTFTCTCDPGYTGPTCGTDINDCSLDPCENGGYCTAGVNTFTCACVPGYTGPTCGTDINDCSPDPCENGGICGDGVNTFTCTCDPGYTGPTCGTDINDCSLDPCENGGYCTDGVNTFTCACVPGYTGPTCGTDINDCSPDPCENGGICSDGVNTFTCTCDPGYTGPTCGTDINDCSLDPCENGGYCTDGVNTFTCACVPGYTGPTCGTDINDCSPDPCENGGICSDGVNTFTCTCDPGYTGPTCGTDINDCSLDPCENGGICIDGVNTFTCACDPGYTGPTCGTADPRPCETERRIRLEERGETENVFIPQCTQDGFYAMEQCYKGNGTYCWCADPETGAVLPDSEVHGARADCDPINDCSPDPCENGGICSDGVNTFTCACNPGHTGPTCGTDINDCSPDPCENGGTCSDGVNTFTCACNPGYTGPTCGTDINDCSPDPCENGGTCSDGVNTFTCACNPGYTGPTCGTDINDCSPDPCENGGICSDGVNTFTCACNPGYTGPTCGTDINDCSPDPCENGGICSDGVNMFTCACNPGHTGPTCGTDINDCSPDPCENGGICSDGVNMFTCACNPGHTGPTCGTDINDCSPDPCENGGICSDGVNTFICACNPGYTGATCGTDINDCSPDPCENGGICSDGVNMFTCACNPGHTGPTCGTDINDCSPDPCENGGICSDGVNMFTCACNPGHTGPTCGTDINDCSPDPCENGGICSDGVNMFTCACNPGHTGPTCGTDINDCSPDPCENGGICSDGVNMFTCACNPGHTGPTCGTDINDCSPDPCENGGICSDGVNTFICACNPGYTGPTCGTDINDCSPDPCENGGICSDGVNTFICACNPGYTGPTCGTDINDCSPDPCENGGICSDGVNTFICACNPGYTGPTCGTDINDCSPDPCENGGICSDGVNTFICACNPGYTGPTCGTDINDCSPDPCENGGICSDGVNTFICACNPGYTGPTCGTDINDCSPDPCENGGICSDGVNMFTCACNPGHTGPTCGTDINDCSPDPCENGGICSDGVNTFICACNPGYTGPTCGTDINDCSPDPCENGGICSDGVNMFTCACNPGHTGPTCGTDINDCSPDPCENGGICSDGVNMFTCACNPGHTGPTCGTDINDCSPDPCENGGICSDGVNMFTCACNPGHTGPTCGTDINDCSPDPCENGGICSDGVNMFTCACNPGHTGPTCGTDINDCSPDPCENGGICSDGVNTFICACNPGYTGPTCGTDINDCSPDPCENGGICSDGVNMFTCACNPGHTGPTCGTDINDCSPDPCENGGICSDGVNTFICACNPGYTGPTCGTDINDCSPDPCENGGICSDGVNMFTCACNPGHTGPTCGTDINDCSPDPCENGGICSDGVNTFICACNPGYTGPTCGTDINDCSPDPCENGGICSDGVNMFTCACNPGHTGPTCGTDINDCSPDPCENGGICSDGVNTFICACNPGYTGPTCGTDINDCSPDPCENGGICSDGVNTFICACNPGYTGPTCGTDINDCSPDPCENGGICSDGVNMFTCACNPGHTGPTCGTDINDCSPDPCENGGICSDGVNTFICACNPGYTGPTCGTDINDCSPDPCENGGICSDGVNTFTCACNPGHTGPTCGTDINDCSPDPCENGGICSDGVNMFTCACNPGHTGPTCGTDINDCSPDPCENGGICSDGVNMFTCACNPGHTGPTCGTDINDCSPDPCENGGICSDGVNMFTCACNPGHTGPTCGTDINDCSPDPCENGGICSDGVNTFICACNPGYTGPTCGTDINDCSPDPCENGGICSDGVNTFICACNPGYTGATCGTDINDCSPDPCENGGICSDGVNTFTCACNPGHTGPTCGTDINDCSPDPCENGGICSDGVNTFTCACNPGYTGPTCGTDINDCSPDPCENGGICSDGVNMFTCACNPGHTGPTCGTDINDCSPDSCENGGICSDGVNTFTCACNPGYTGPTCGTDINDCSPDSCENEGICSDGVNTFTCACNPGYTGPTCGTDINDCSPDPCENEGICSDGVNMFTCACNPGHTGPTCGTDINDCSPDPCENGGICSDGVNTFTCACNPGYTGPTCGTDINDCSPDPCENGGICSDGVNTFICACNPGYTGPTCGTDINDCSPDPCENGGICSDGVNTFTCACNPGYTGPTCGTDINDCSPDPCENGGICSDGVNTFTCACNPGYTGPTCGTDINDCSPDPCENGGICSDGVNMLTCACDPGYTGPTCGTDINDCSPDPCENGGICSDGVNMFTCACDPGYTGPTCGTDINDCSPDPCENGGICSDGVNTFTCCCNPGHTGPTCGTDINDCSPDPCENGGICSDGVNTFTCACNPGYTGPTCGTDINDCSPDPCENGGICSDGVNMFTCACDPGYTGPTCGTDINDCSPDPCENGGICNDGVNAFTCACNPGYTGPTCGTDINDCSPDPCENGGICSDGVNTFTCACNPGYTGPTCGTDINDCSPDPCENGGICSDGVNTFTCACDPGFTGPTCGTDINDCSPDPCENGGICSDGVNTFICACNPGYTGPTCGTGSSSAAEVRLAGSGSSANQGRVEVYANGQWGTVCDDLWGQRDADVVCRQLGFPGASSYTIHANTFGAGSGPIHLDDMRCVGNERSIMDCPKNAIGFHDCRHSDDAGVICRVGQVSQSTEICRGTEVRLAGSGNSANQGRVEVYANGQWGTVCDDLWGLDDADVVCRQLGFPGASSYTIHAMIFGAGSGPILLDDMRCVGNETSIMDCPKNAIGVHNCQHSDDAGVICHVNQEVRLAGSGSSANQGRVEVFANGQWGTVCDDLWEQREANVVCRQLGFPGASGFTRGAMIFGEGSGPIFLDNMKCVGDETSIMDCPKNRIGAHNCQHSDDAGVICRVAQGSSCGAEMRLAGTGSSANQGRVEVYLNGQWGTVCSDLWGLDDADVVCRQLGFPGASGFTMRARTFGEGSGPIFLDNVRCVGDETSINDCVKNAIGFHNCLHSDDAGVICQLADRSMEDVE